MGQRPHTAMSQDGGVGDPIPSSAIYLDSTSQLCILHAGHGQGITEKQEKEGNGFFQVTL
jgi:hypothetical protein